MSHISTSAIVACGFCILLTAGAPTAWAGGDPEGANNLASQLLLPHGDGLAVFTWGRGEDGQLGLGDRPKPRWR